MRILIDLQACQTASRQRGIGRYSLALADALARLPGRHELSLLLNAAFPESVEWLRDRFVPSIPSERIHVFATPEPVAEIEPANRWRARAAEAIRDASVATLRPDVMLLSSLFEGFVDGATTSIAQASDHLTAAILYDLIPLVRPDVLTTPASRAWYERKLAALRRADLLLAISGHARSEAMATLRLPSERIAVISTAADACFRPLRFGEDDARSMHARYGVAGRYVLYAGGFDERKNVRNLIAAYATLSADVRGGHQLLLAGSIDERERRELRRFAQRNRLRRSELLFTGYVDDAELAALYGLCTVFAFPSLHEGFGLPVLEAMSCGAAVIGSSATSVPEVIGRQDALFDPSDVEAIAGRLDAVLSDADLREDLRRYGLERATHFSWDATARCALDALTGALARREHVARTSFAVGQRALPTLAFVSPLPPERTGVAYYSAELLMPLQQHYRIELVTDQRSVELPGVLATLPIRTLEWFDAHAAGYDRTLYQFGNSPFHHRMFDLSERHPGTVVMHDLHVGGVLNWMDQYAIAPGIFLRWLFESHGYPALIADRDLGRDATIDAFPCSWPVIDNANGVIVHSAHALQLADSWFRIGRAEWREIGQLRRLPDLARRDAARTALGFSPDDVLFCSFGFLAATKLDDRIVDAWLASPLASDRRYTLAFVGENHGGEYGQQLLRRLARASGRVRITGYVDAAGFDDYLLAADAAVQLRGVSRGETSRTVLDCLACGLPTIVNASGSLRELPDDVVLRLPSAFSNDELAAAMARIAGDSGLRGELGRRARRYIADHHDPDQVAVAFRDAIEHFARDGRQTHYGRAVRAVAEIDADPPPEPSDWRAAAASIAVDLRRPAARQLLVDVSILAKQDLKTGIERVVRAVLRQLIDHAPAGCRVEPVMAAHGCYLYARRFTCAWLDIASSPADDTPVEVAAGDVFLGLDWAANIVPDQETVLQRYRTLGVDVTFVVYDLLPVLRPEFYPSSIDAMHGAWLATVATVASGVLCISNAVADELVEWLAAHAPHRVSALELAVLPLGSDIEQSAPSRGVEPDKKSMLDEMDRRPSVLMVGTVEPRKAHAQALAAFESLWRQGTDLNLVIAGKQGWMVDDVASRMRGHPERGRRLFWFEGASDELLERLYAKVDVLLAPSFGEGYGLPLVEAARHGVPLLVRDLPVFREVAGDGAMYFTGSTPEALARAIVDWKQADADGRVPAPPNVQRKTWRECADALVSVLLDGKWEREWRPADGSRRSPSAPTVRQIDFSQAWLPPAVRSIKGLSGREQWGRWSDADVHPHVEIRFRDPLPARGSLALTARAFGPNVGKPVRVRIGRHETELHFDAQDSTAVATYALSQAPESLELVPPHPMPPRELGGSEDPRRLGIGLVRLTIRST